MAATLGLSLFDTFVIPLGQSTRAITASTTKAGAIFRATKTGNIRWIGTTYSALSGAPVLDLRIETVDASILPTSTLFGANTNASYAPAAANTFVWTQLTADAAVTEGNTFAAVVGYTSGTSATCVYALGNMTVAIPTTLVMSAGTWAPTTQCPTICVKYDDGAIIRGQVPVNRYTNTNIQSGSNPNERASVWTQPLDAQITGVRFGGFFNTTSAAEVNLYAGTSTSPVSGGTIVIPAGQVMGNGGHSVQTVSFPAPISLTRGTTYRLGVKITVAVNTTLHRLEFPGTAERDATVGEMWSDTRAGASWLGEVTTTSEMIYPLFSALNPAYAAASDVRSGTDRGDGTTGTLVPLENLSAGDLDDIAEAAWTRAGRTLTG